MNEKDIVSDTNENRDFPAEAEARNDERARVFRGTHAIVSEFVHNGNRYAFYRLNDIMPALYITGDTFSWESGWKYDEVMGHIIMTSYVSDGLRIAIKIALMQMRNKNV